MTRAQCPFCSVDGLSIIGDNNTMIAVMDQFPISPGHALIIPRRHVSSYFDLNDTERNDLQNLLAEIRSYLITTKKPDGFNIGINDGCAAGQTIMHMHLHVIPRYMGDVHDPRGGVRWIIPERARYWSEE